MAMSLRISDELLSALDQEVRVSALTRSEVVRLALENYLAQQRKERLRRVYIAQARQLVEDEVWRDLEQDFAESDAQTLQVADSIKGYRTR